MNSYIKVFEEKGDELEHCTNCYKQGKHYTILSIDLFRVPFCPDCFNEFVAMLNAFNKKGKFNERNQA